MYLYITFNIIYYIQTRHQRSVLFHLFSNLHILYISEKQLSQKHVFRTKHDYNKWFLLVRRAFQ